MLTSGDSRPLVEDRGSVLMPVGGLRLPADPVGTIFPCSDGRGRTGDSAARGSRSGSAGVCWRCPVIRSDHEALGDPSLRLPGDSLALHEPRPAPYLAQRRMTCWAQGRHGWTTGSPCGARRTACCLTVGGSIRTSLRDATTCGRSATGGWRLRRDAVREFTRHWIPAHGIAGRPFWDTCGRWSSL